MSGWIKLDKELPESIRFRRVVRSVRERNALPGVTDRDEAFVKTLCIGALVRLWIYADSHIDESNRISASFDEIDELVGVPGFAASMPPDWLRKVDDETVELPDFLEHNGSSAKHRRDNASRQARWRERQKSRDITDDVTPRNARNAARPDQTRPNRERGNREGKKSSKRAPEDFSPDLEYARSVLPDIDAEAEARKLKDWEFKTARSDWEAVWRTWIANCKDKGQYSRKTNSKGVYANAI